MCLCVLEKAHLFIFEQFRENQQILTILGIHYPEELKPILSTSPLLPYCYCLPWEMKKVFFQQYSTVIGIFHLSGLILNHFHSIHHFKTMTCGRLLVYVTCTVKRLK